MQDLYDNRPSRSEDLELIKALQEEVMEKDLQLKKAAEDMKFYKLELLNREENYNKIFGSKPVVGVLNPLDYKVQININMEFNSDLETSNYRKAREREFANQRRV